MIYGRQSSMIACRLNPFMLLFTPDCMRLSMKKQSPNRMDKSGQRKAIKHAQPCVIGDAKRWMLQKEVHHLYPFVAATILAMPNKTGAAARSTSQSHMARNRNGGSSCMA